MQKHLIALLESTKSYSLYQFALWRILFGVYLLYYAILQIPYVVELYSAEGVYHTPVQPLLFPSILYISATPTVVYVLAGAQVLASLGIMLGFQRRILALVYLLVAGSFWQWNPMTEDPSLSFVHLAGFLLMLVPTGEPLSFFRNKERIWKFPAFVYFAALFAMGIGYSISGYDKFLADGWLFGDAMFYLYNYPIAFNYWFVDMLRAQPMWLIQFETWTAAGAMLFALPALLYKRTRFLMWSILTLMFIVTLFIFDLTQVSLGMLLFHLFLFDRAWVPAKQGSISLYYDENCRFCRACVSFIKTEDMDNQVTTVALEQSKHASENACYESIIVEIEGNQYQYSDAVIHSLLALGGVWRILGCLLFSIPRPLRDYGYKIVGRNRYLFGGAKTC